MVDVYCAVIHCLRFWRTIICLKTEKISFNPLICNARFPKILDLKLAIRILLVNHQFSHPYLQCFCQAHSGALMLLTSEVLNIMCMLLKISFISLVSTEFSFLFEILLM